METWKLCPDRRFPFELMRMNAQALDRLELQFTWGNYGIRVLKFHYTTFPPGKVVDYHKHSEYEFHYIPRGKGIVILEGTTYPLQDGMMYVTGPNVVHRQEADSAEAMEEFCLHLDIHPLQGPAQTEASQHDWGRNWENSEAEQCFRELEGLPKMPVPDQHGAMNGFAEAYTAWSEKKLGLYTLLKQSIIQILLRTLSAYTSDPGNTLPVRDMKEHRCLMAVQFIRDNYMLPITLENVADKVQISPRQLQRILRGQTGETFTAYLENLRISQICSELTISEDSIERLAVRNGFSNGNYLHHVFKKRLGITPLQYRERHSQAAAER